VCVAADPKRAEIRSNLGAVLAGLGRYEEAISEYRAAIATAPPAIAPQLHFNLALAYYKSSQLAEAAGELEPLRAAQPGNTNLVLLLADCRLRMGEYDRAIDLLLPVEASHRDQPGVDYALGMALIRNGRTAEGQQRVDRILGRGESAEGHFLLGSALFQSGNFPAAAKAFSKAAALKPELPSLQSYYGQALLFTGDADGASAAFRKELASNPNDFDANFQLASILWHRGKPAEARPLLERAARLRPGSAEARDALANGFRSRAPENDGIAIGAPAPPIAGLELTRPVRPVVLVFGSYTCPKFRTSAAVLKRLSEEHKGKLDFRLIYIREAHAGADWQSTINERDGIALEPAKTVEQKREHAQLCLRKLDLPWAAIADGIDGAAEAAYQAWPSRVYIVDRHGRVAFNSRLGELEFQPARMEGALRAVLAR
jgi:tetratricopeptide (TPR) repeat protein